MSVKFSGYTILCQSSIELDHHVVVYPRPVEPDSVFSLANANACVLLRLLEVPLNDPSDLFGSLSLSDARRAVIKARAQFAQRSPNFVRESDVQYGYARSNTDGTVELRPVRSIDFGLDAPKLLAYLDRLEALVLELQQLGATHLSWG